MDHRLLYNTKICIDYPVSRDPAKTNLCTKDFCTKMCPTMLYLIFKTGVRFILYKKGMTKYVPCFIL